MLVTQRPHAAWAIWRSVLQEFPDDAAARAALDTLTASTELPEVARKPLRFLPPASESARKRWDKALRVRLASSETPAAAAPADAALAFRGLVEESPDDAEAIWNLAVCQAWIGSNRSAVETLDRFVELTAEPSPDRAADAWMLAELLRHGAGAEDLADALKFTQRIPASIRMEHSAEDFAKAFGWLINYGPKSEEPSGPVPFFADVLQCPLNQAGHAASTVVASVLSECILFLVSAPASPAAGLFFRELRDQLRYFSKEQQIAEVEVEVLNIALLDAAAFRFRLPPDIPDELRRRLSAEAIGSWFETDWIDQPRHGLGRLSPAQAAGIPVAAMRARLEGIIQFQEQLARRPGHEQLYGGYDFDRLRYRLGLGRPAGDIDAKGEARHKALSLYDPAHVRNLKPETLSPADLAVAWQTAFAVHDDATAIRLGYYVVHKSPDALAHLSTADFIAPFLRRMLRDGITGEAVRDWIAFALKTDAELHGGRDAFRLLEWKAEMVSRQGDADAASRAWRVACAHPGAPPIVAYRAVVDLWDLPGGNVTAMAFAAESLAETINPYVRALLRQVIENESSE